MRSINDKFIIFRANYNKMMNRIFHVKIAGGTYFLLILLTAVMVFAFLVYEGNDRIGSSIGSDHYY